MEGSINMDAFKSRLWSSISFPINPNNIRNCLYTEGHVSDMQRIGIKNSINSCINDLVRMYFDDNGNDYNLCHIKNNENLILSISSTFHIRIKIVDTYIDYGIIIENSEIFVAGCYSKLARNIAHSPSNIASLRTSITVSDIKHIFKHHFNGDSSDFISIGREDIDVKCYSRPFLVRVKNPKNNFVADIIKERLDIIADDKIRLLDVFIVQPEVYKIFTDPNKSYRKEYRCLIRTNDTSSLDTGVFKGQIELTLLQETPLRVLHRRANLKKHKSIKARNFKVLDGNMFIFDILADSGTYIKEFVNGDFGRTNPSLKNICGDDCELVELDVLEVCDFNIPENLRIRHLLISKEEVSEINSN